MKARVSQLHKTEAEWSKYSNWVPEAGEFVVFDPDDTFTYARIKLGDGKRTLKDLSFFIDSSVDAFFQKHRYETIIDGGRITEHNK